MAFNVFAFNVLALITRTTHSSTRVPPQASCLEESRIATIQGNSPSQARLSDDPVDTILVFPLLAAKMETDFFHRFDDEPAGPVRLGDESGDTAIPVVQRT